MLYVARTMLLQDVHPSVRLSVRHIPVLHRNGLILQFIYSSLFTITVVEYNIKNTLTNKLN